LTLREREKIFAQNQEIEVSVVVFKNDKVMSFVLKKEEWSTQVESEIKA
jgi:hypothetical protein